MRIKVIDNENPIEEAAPISEELDDIKATIYEVLQKAYLSQDYIRAISVAPHLVETVRVWIEEYDLPPMVKQLLVIEEGDADVPITGAVYQSQVELDWLRRHFRTHPILATLQAEQSPLILNYSDFKLLYLLELWDKTNGSKTSGLWKPGM